MEIVWKDLKLLNNNYKNLINNYFKDFSGKFIIEDNILIVNFDSWGIEKFYIYKNELKIDYYNVIFENFNKIYNIAISIQIGNWVTFKKMEKYLENFKKININIYFILNYENTNDDNVNYLIQNYRNCVILSGENRGMDIGLFFINLLYIKHNKYIHDYLFKIHTKTNDEFRNNTLHKLIGSHSQIIDNIKLLNKKNIGMVSGNTIFKYNQYKDAFRSNYYHLNMLVNYLYNEDVDNNILEFCAGTMFIIKMNSLEIFDIKKLEHIYSILNNSDTIDYYWYSVFYKMNINNKEDMYKDYINNKEKKFSNNISYHLKTGKPGLRDCMIEHGIERLFGYVCKKMNYDIV